MKRERRVFNPNYRLAIIQEGEREGSTAKGMEGLKPGQEFCCYGYENETGELRKLDYHINEKEVYSCKHESAIGLKGLPIT